MKNNNKLFTYLIACRPNHWTKNLIVFAAPLFSFQFSDFQIWISSAWAFLSFCFISSAVYLLNDIIDIKADQSHPVKKFRPIASGLLSKKIAYLISFLLTILSFSLAKYVDVFLALLVAIYLFVQILYCLKLKNEPLLDLQCISSGFLIRAIAGGLASGLYLSPWFLLTIWLISLFLAVEKRKAELKNLKNNNFNSRKVLKRYSLPLLLRIESLVSTGAFMSYSLWSAGPLLNGASTSLMLLTLPLVLTGIFRYQLLSDESYLRDNILPYKNRLTEKPEKIIFQDKGIKYIIISWFIVVLIISLFAT